MLTEYKIEHDEIGHVEEFSQFCDTYSNMRTQVPSTQTVINKKKDAAAAALIFFAVLVSPLPTFVVFDSPTVNNKKKNAQKLFKRVGAAVTPGFWTE